MDIANREDLHTALTDEGMTFGYRLFFTTRDGCALCEQCVRGSLQERVEDLDADYSGAISGASLTDADHYLPSSVGGGLWCDECSDAIAEPDSED